MVLEWTVSFENTRLDKFWAKSELEGEGKESMNMNKSYDRSRMPAVYGCNQLLLIG